MDLSLTEEQQILSRTAREFLEAECPTTVVREAENAEEGYLPDLWKKMAYVDIVCIGGSDTSGLEK